MLLLNETHEIKVYCQGKLVLSVAFDEQFKNNETYQSGIKLDQNDKEILLNLLKTASGTL